MPSSVEFAGTSAGLRLNSGPVHGLNEHRSTALRCGTSCGAEKLLELGKADEMSGAGTFESVSAWSAKARLDSPAPPRDCNSAPARRVLHTVKQMLILRAKQGGVS